jgi:hypothetical protein
MDIRQSVPCHLSISRHRISYRLSDHSRVRDAVWYRRRSLFSITRTGFRRKFDARAIDANSRNERGSLSLYSSLSLCYFLCPIVRGTPTNPSRINPPGHLTSLPTLHTYHFANKNQTLNTTTVHNNVLHQHLHLHRRARRRSSNGRKPLHGPAIQPQIPLGQGPPSLQTRQDSPQES